MREILFRGKTEKGKWIEGDLYQSRLKSIFMISRYTEHGNRMTEVVNLETVGQYTDLTDKNGKKIFEGDIVKVEGKHYEVKYMLGQFFIGINMPIAYKRFECKIVGNIHDNPELLKGGEG